MIHTLTTLDTVISGVCNRSLFWGWYFLMKCAR